MPSLDLKLILSTLVVLVLGLLIHYSFSPESITLHLGFILAGLIGAFILTNLDSRVFSHFAPHLYALAILILLSTLALGAATRGATRWLSLGSFRFQPSEFAKPLVILSLAQFISQTQITSFIKLTKILILAAIPAFLVFLQPDLGSAIVIAIIATAMIFTSGMRYRHLALLALIGLSLTPLIWFSLKPYQQSRIHSFLDPSSDPLGKGYNSIQSIIAVGSGRITGLGLGHGTQSRLQFLPEHQTDFVFASMAEELGLIGSMVIILSYAWMLWRLLSLARRSDSTYSFLVLIGIVAVFASQVIINIGMNIGLLPITGITLPLVSSGGSSMITSLILLGLALSLGKKSANTRGIEISLD